MRCIFLQLLPCICFLCLNQPLLLAQADSLKAGKYYQQAEGFLLKGKSEKAIKNYFN